RCECGKVADRLRSNFCTFCSKEEKLIIYCIECSEPPKKCRHQPESFRRKCKSCEEDEMPLRGKCCTDCGTKTLFEIFCVLCPTDTPHAGNPEASGRVKKMSHTSDYEECSVEEPPNTGHRVQGRPVEETPNTGDRVQGRLVEETPNTGDFEEGRPVEETPNTGDRDQRCPVEETPNTGDRVQGRPVEETPNTGDRVQGRLVEETPNPGDRDQRRPVEETPNTGDFEEGRTVEETPNTGDFEEGRPVEETPNTGDRDEGRPVEKTPNRGDRDQRRHVEETPNTGDRDQRRPVEETPNTGDRVQGRPVEETPNTGDRDQGRPVEETPSTGDRDQGRPVEETPNTGDSDQGRPVEETPNTGDSDQGRPVEETPNTGDRVQRRLVEETPNKGDCDQRRPIEETPNTGDLLEGRPVEETPNTGDRVQGRPVEETPNPGDRDEGRPVEETPNTGDFEEGRPVEETPNTGHRDQRRPVEETPNTGHRVQGHPVEETPNTGDFEEGRPVEETPNTGDREKGCPVIEKILENPTDFGFAARDDKTAPHWHNNLRLIKLADHCGAVRAYLAEAPASTSSLEKLISMSLPPTSLEEIQALPDNELSEVSKSVQKIMDELLDKNMPDLALQLVPAYHLVVLAADPRSRQHILKDQKWDESKPNAWFGLASKFQYHSRGSGSENWSRLKKFQNISIDFNALMELLNRFGSVDSLLNRFCAGVVKQSNLEAFLNAPNVTLDSKLALCFRVCQEMGSSDDERVLGIIESMCFASLNTYLRCLLKLRYSQSTGVEAGSKDEISKFGDLLNQLIKHEVDTFNQQSSISVEYSHEIISMFLQDGFGNLLASLFGASSDSSSSHIFSELSSLIEDTEKGDWNRPWDISLHTAMTLEWPLAQPLLCFLDPNAAMVQLTLNARTALEKCRHDTETLLRDLETEPLSKTVGAIQYLARHKASLKKAANVLRLSSDVDKQIFGAQEWKAAYDNTVKKLKELHALLQKTLCSNIEVAGCKFRSGGEIKLPISKLIPCLLEAIDEWEAKIERLKSEEATWEAAQFLKSLFDREEELVKELSYLLLRDLAMIYLGDSGDLEQKKIEVLVQVVNDFQEIIYGIEALVSNEERRVTEFLELCRPVMERLQKEPKRIEDLTKTANQLKWIKIIKENQGSVERPTLEKIEEIFKSGSFQIGCLVENTDHFLLTTTKESKADDSPKTQSRAEFTLADVKDLQSKLMLIAGSAYENKLLLDSFVKLTEGILRLVEVYKDFRAHCCLLCEQIDIVVDLGSAKAAKDRSTEAGIEKLEEVLVCSDQTTEEDVSVFMHRSVLDQNSQALYVIMGAEQLSYQNSVFAEDIFSRLLDLVEGRTKAKIFALMADDQQRNFPFCSILASFIQDYPIIPNEKDIRDWTAKFLREQTPEENFRVLNFLPCIQCRSPSEILEAIADGKSDNAWEPLLKDELLTSDSIRKPVKYLLNKKDRRTVQLSAKDVVKLLVENCGIENPSWQELQVFSRFFCRQISDMEKSPYCSEIAGSEIQGFQEFVLKFMLIMSKDFATRSLSISDESGGSQISDGKFTDSPEKEDLQNFQLRRRWEQNSHPYLLFNEDGATFTFVGFTINPAGDLLDQKRAVIQKGIMSQQLYKGLHRQGVHLDEAFDSLPRDEMINKIRMVFGFDNRAASTDPDLSYELTTDNAMKMLAIYMRFRCEIPVVLMGETGCGKTKLVEFLSKLMLPEGHPPLSNIRILKVHGGVSEAEVVSTLREAEKLAAENFSKSKRSPYTIVFFDEVNTTSAVGLIKEVMIDGRAHGKPIDFSKGLRCVAACNPYRKHSEETIKILENSGLGYRVRKEQTSDRFGTVPMRHLVYRVKPLPLSFLQVLWDFGNLTDESERKYIDRIIESRKTAFSEPAASEKELNILKNAIAASQRFMRTSSDEAKFVSLRDVEKAMKMLEWLYRKHVRLQGFIKTVGQQMSEVGILYASSFPKDQEYSKMCTDINKIKVSMERGGTLVLLNIENLYESLYDALNQYYEYCGQDRFVDLGLGTHRLKCKVHKEFRIIVIADQSTVEEKFPIPLINRLEKHKLSTEAILNDEKRYTIRQILEWVQLLLKLKSQIKDLTLNIAEVQRLEDLPDWDRIQCVFIFLTEVVNAFDSEAHIEESDIKPIQLWNSLQRKLKENFQSLEAIRIIEEFVDKMNTSLTEKILGSKDCSKCKKRSDFKLILPCADRLCAECVADCEVSENHADSRKCPICKQDFDPKAVSGPKQQVLVDFKARCTRFMMQVVSKLCFQAAKPPTEDLCHHLIGFVTRTSKQNAAFGLFGDDRDDSPVFRSFILQRLLKFQPSQVESLLQQHVDAVANFRADARHDLAKIIVNCMEDAQIVRSEAEAMNEEQQLHHAVSLLAESTLPEKLQLLQIPHLQNIASRRVALRVLAFVFSLGNLGEETVNALARALEPHKWSRIYFLRCLSMEKLYNQLAYLTQSPLPDHNAALLCIRLAYVLHANSTNESSAFRKFLKDLKSLADNSYLPAMMHDEIWERLLEMINCPITTKDKEGFLCDENFKMYCCPNGHPYVLGECTQGWVKYKCHECAADIGGQKHKIAANNTEYKCKTKMGFSPPSMKEGQQPLRKLTPASAALIRLLQHLAMLVSPDSRRKLQTPDANCYLRGFVDDLKLFSQVTGRNASSRTFQEAWHDRSDECKLQDVYEFGRIWDELKHRLKLARFEDLPYPVVKGEVSACDLPLAALLPHSSEWGRCIVALVQLLVDAQNAVIDASAIKTEKISLDDIDQAAVIPRDLEAGLLPILLANSSYSLKDAACVEYDFKSLECQLVDFLARGRCRIAPLLSPIVYKDEVHLMQLFKRLERTVPQNSAPSSVPLTQALSSNLPHELRDITELLDDSLPAAMRFLISLAPKDTQELLHAFMTERLAMPGLPTPQLQRSVTLADTKLLWMFLDHLRCRCLIRSDLNPFEDCGEVIELPMELPKELKNRRSILMEKLHAFIRLELSSGPAIYEGMELQEVCDIFPEYDEFSAFDGSFLCEHAVAVWTALNRME
uniref:RING-type domain-containing protein n=1 Tax=Macrostomum lignano TaxID=282301 RepID=A0A1I8GD15_9PLAT